MLKYLRGILGVGHLHSAGCLGQSKHSDVLPFIFMGFEPWTFVSRKMGNEEKSPLLTPWITAFIVLLVLPPEVLMSTLEMVPKSDLQTLRKELESSVALSLQSQRVVLKQVAEVLKNGGNSCNAFAGTSSCLEAATNPHFTSLCGGSSSSNKTVDCGFRLKANMDFREKLEKAGYTGCGDCTMAVQEFWCAQATPACGTFDYVVQEILPLVSSVSTRKTSALSALKESVPRLFQAASLGLPCRKMCNAITTSCSCSHSHTFGEVLASLDDKSLPSISLPSAKAIFSDIWHTPVCELFADDETPGFSGVCQHVPDSSRCDWCKISKARPSLFYDQVVLQLVEMFYGMMENGLQPVLKAAAGGKGALQDGWNKSLSNGEVSQAHHFGVVVLLLFMLLLAVGGFLAAVRAHRHRQIPSQYIDLHSMGYSPPML